MLDIEVIFEPIVAELCVFPITRQVFGGDHIVDVFTFATGKVGYVEWDFQFLSCVFPSLSTLPIWTAGFPTTSA